MPSGSVRTDECNVLLGPFTHIFPSETDSCTHTPSYYLYVPLLGNDIEKTSVGIY